MLHVPVLLKETIEILDPKPGEIFIDATFGGGGHAKEILKNILPNGKLLAIDWDKDTVEKAKKNIVFQKPEVKLEIGNYADLPKIMEKLNFPKADGMLLDLGFLSDQMESGKGFSFLKDEPLDMRFSQNGDLAAAQVVNSFSEKELADIFFKYGEERFSRQIAKEILKERKRKRILTTFELVEIIKKAVPKNYERGRINPATRVFQALRIYINSELENLETVLGEVSEILKPGGRIAIISFHSLEDRIVKNRFKDLEREGKAKILAKKPITAGQEEIKNNPKSRSAKLRALYKF
ncbi:MAG: 16S rRNA (cytosine(1402)-N(4))-methyltransferase RsmH [Candidatus Shapirobacteria bacterium]